MNATQRARQRWTLLLVCTAAFMLLLDITVVSVALPSIQRDLHASLPDLQWVSASYALVLAVLLLPAATLGDRMGRRLLFLVGMVIFTVGSLACALAPTALALELSRALQGVGGAALFATATPLLRAEFSGAALARALGVFGATIGGASAVGPLAGGVLTDNWGGGPSSSSTCPSAWRRSWAVWPGCANPATRPAAAGSAPPCSSGH
jgi:MFS family permease